MLDIVVEKLRTELPSLGLEWDGRARASVLVRCSRRRLVVRFRAGDAGAEAARPPLDERSIAGQCLRRREAVLWRRAAPWPVATYPPVEEAWAVVFAGPIFADRREWDEPDVARRAEALAVRSLDFGQDVAIIFGQPAFRTNLDELLVQLIPAFAGVPTWSSLNGLD